MKSTTFVVLMLLVGMLLFGCASMSPQNYTPNGTEYYELNSEQIQCYKGGLDSLKYDFKSLSLSANISEDWIYGQSARCLHKSTGDPEYNPYELELRGYYFPNGNSPSKQFDYIEIHISGSPGGSGAYDEECLIVDNKTIISKIESGTHPKYSFSPSRCAWQDNPEPVTPPQNATYQP